VNITNYPYNGYITVVMVGFHKSVTWAYQYLNNGTYLMIFTWPKQIPSGYPISLIQNPPGLCLIQVIRVKPGTPDNYILNMTYLGAQYVTWVFTEAAWGKPAPCYWPTLWTYGGTGFTGSILPNQLAQPGTTTVGLRVFGYQ